MGDTLSQADSEAKVTEAVQHRQWENVLKLLPRCGDDTVRWAVGEASKHAGDEDLQRIVADFSAAEHHEQLMKQAVRRHLWRTAAHLLQGRGAVSDSLRTLAVTAASESDEDCHFTRCFLPHCPRSSRESVLETVVRRGHWQAVLEILRAGVSERKRQWATAETARQAAEQVVLDMLKFCTADQSDFMLEQSARRRFWRVANVLLLQQAPPTQQRRNTVEKASQLATEDELLKMIQHLHTQELDVVFVLAVMRGLWRLVGVFLDRGVTESRRQWALQEAERRADSTAMTQHILCRYEYRRVVTDDAVRRRFPDAVRNLLKSGGVSDSVLSKVIVDACALWPVDKFVHLLDNLSEKQFASVFFQLVQFRLDAEKLIRILDRQHQLRELHQLVRFWARVFVESLRVIATRPGDVIEDFHWMVLFHARVAELFVYRIESINRRERDSEQVFRFQIKEWARSVEICCATEGCELGITEAVIEDLFLQCFFRRRDEETFTVCMRFIAALQSIGPNVQKLGLEKLRDVWEEVRRSVFKTSVELKDWPVVSLMADHRLYDDQRGWAAVEALHDKQWDVVMKLTKHGMTDDQLKRVHRQMAKHADWQSVVRLFEGGADLRHVREDLEIANECRERPPSQETLTKYRRRLRQLKTLENRTAEEARSLSLALKRNNWQAVLFRLRSRSSVKQKAKILSIALKRQAWHVVAYLVRLDMPQAEKDMLFQECVKHKQWGLARLLMERLVDPDISREALSTLLDERQWILVALIMDVGLDDVGRLLMMRKAMEARESSVVSHGITLLEGRLSVEDRNKFFAQALKHQMWQVLKRLVEERDATGIHHRDVTLPEAVLRRQWDVIKHCQQYGADIDVRKDSNDTFLHRAAKEGDWETVEGLLYRGANPNLTDSTGNIVIHRAVDVPHWDATSLLVQFHADLTFPDPVGGESVLQKLIKSTVPSEHFFAAEPTIEEQAKVIDTSIVWSGRVDYGDTYRGKNSLHVVCQAGLWDALRYLAARGGDPLAVTEDGRTVLWMAMENRDCTRRLVAECVKLGISTFQAGSDDGRHPVSPFAMAVGRDELTVARMLYESGACSNREVYQHFMEQLAQSGSVSASASVSVSAAAFALAPVSASARVSAYAPVSASASAFASARVSAYAPVSAFASAHEGVLTSESALGVSSRTGTGTRTLCQLRQMATQPRSLMSLCRLVISHQLGVRQKRRKRVRQLPLSEKMKSYVLFSDVVHESFGQGEKE